MMDNNFWRELKKPIATLAPMEDVTDTVFRELTVRRSDKGKLNVIFSEFTSTDGLCHPIGNPKVSQRLKINPSEKKLLSEKDVKIVAQIWGNDPEKNYKSSKMITEMGQFDGIDINMGCPVKKIVKQGCCSALIDQPELAKEIILAVKEGTNLPVSVKTRTGIKVHKTEEWISHLLSVAPNAIILHARTQKMMTDYPADWNEVRKAVEIRNKLLPECIIIGNGDIFSYEQALELVSQSGADGFMVGRGIFSNPWFFASKNNISKEEKIKELWEHSVLFYNTWGNNKNFAILNRFFKIYISNFDGAAELRSKLMQAKNLDELRSILISECPEQESNLHIRTDTTP